MPRHPGQGSMTKGRPPGKRELRKEGKRRGERRGTRLIDGEAPQICAKIIYL